MIELNTLTLKQVDIAEEINITQVYFEYFSRILCYLFKKDINPSWQS